MKARILVVGVLLFRIPPPWLADRSACPSRLALALAIGSSWHPAALHSSLPRTVRSLVCPGAGALMAVPGCFFLAARLRAIPGRLGHRRGSSSLEVIPWRLFVPAAKSTLGGSRPSVARCVDLVSSNLVVLSAGELVVGATKSPLVAVGTGISEPRRVKQRHLCPVRRDQEQHSVRVGVLPCHGRRCWLPQTRAVPPPW